MSNAERVLDAYYALRVDWQTGGMGGYNGESRTAYGSECSRTVAFMCDVGRALESCLTLRERQEILPRRWYAQFRADQAAETYRKTRAMADRASRGSKMHKLSRDMEAIARWELDTWSRECDALSRRKEYRAILRKVDNELRARDLYARASIGEWAGVAKRPEWSVLDG